jgi:hypothetical protein
LCSRAKRVEENLNNMKYYRNDYRDEYGKHLQERRKLHTVEDARPCGLNKLAE